MRIDKLVLRNFKQFKEQTISFPDGLVGFIGRNGAGKSTIFEAIYIGLFGKYEGDKNRIKNDLADSKESVFLELTFEDKGKLYRVLREYKGKTLTIRAELHCDDISICSGSTDVTKYISRLLKIDSKNFKNSFFSQQKEVTALLGMVKSERQLQLRKMLGLSKLDKLESRIKDEERDLRYKKGAKSEQIIQPDQIEALSKECDDHKAKEIKLKKLHDAALTNLEKAIHEYDDSKTALEKLESIKNTYEKLNSRLEITQTKYDQNRSRIAESEDEIAELKKLKNELPELKIKKERYDFLEREINKLLETKSIFKQKENLEREVEKLKKMKSQKEGGLEEAKKQSLVYTGTDKKITVLEKSLNSKQGELEKTNKSRDRINSKIASSAGELETIESRKNEIKKLGRTSPCPECERPLHDHYDTLIEKYDQLSESIIKEIAGYNEVLGTIEEKVVLIKSEIKADELKLRKLEGDESKLEKINESIERFDTELDEIASDLKEKEAEYKPLIKIKYEEKDFYKASDERSGLADDAKAYIANENETSKIPGKRESLKQLNEKSDEYKGVINSAKKEIFDLGYNPKQYDLAKDHRNKREASKDDYSRSERGLKEELHDHTQEIKLIEKRLRDNEKNYCEVQLMELDINLHQRLASYVNEFKNKLTSRELPAISEEASRLFSEITKSRYNDLRITDEYEFSVNREGFVVPLETLSGGEKDLAGLCLRVAISKRIAFIAGRKNMGFLALDEVFGSQDEQRREELLKALHPISKDFKQIFVISHNEDVHSAFEANLLIKKVGNYSKVELVV